MSFKRTEQKYFVSENAKTRILRQIEQHVTPDNFGVSTIMSLYLDTPDHRIIRESLDARAYGSAYRAKLRIRCYNTPTLLDRAYIELKQKYKSTVYKRRLGTSLGEAYRYLYDGVLPERSQIMSEIDYMMRHYSAPQPSFLIAYEREAYFSKYDRSLRITFDQNVRYRTSELALEIGSHGKPVKMNNDVLIEIKSSSALPLWLSDCLSCEGAFPTSFSKYAAAYADSKTLNNTEKSHGARDLQHIFTP